MQLSGKQVRIGTALVVLVILGLTAASPWGRRAAVSLSRPFMKTWNYLTAQGHELVTSDSDKSARLAELESRLREMEVAIAENRELREENRQLRRLLDIRQYPGWTVLQAQLLTRDPALWDLGFTIDKGSADGISAGSLVLSDDHVIGRVSTVNQHHSMVDTLVSPRCRLGVVLEGTEIHGLMHGTGRWIPGKLPGCLVDYLPLTADAEANDLVVTSGLGGELPGGLPVAMATPLPDGKLLEEVDHARKQLHVSPLDNWDSLRVVSVIVSSKK